MTARWRWLLVAALVVALTTVPPVVRAWPVSDSNLSATTLRTAIVDAVDLGWSGEVRTQGTLSIPDTDSFGGVARLLGEESTLRVWWRGPEHWRVDRIRSTGETDLVRDGGRITSWNFESRTATVTPYSDVRLPDDSDLLPPRLAGRLLAGATDDDVARLPVRRVAGRDAPGLRLIPADDRSTIRQVDLWADEKSGLPLRVEVFGTDDGLPVVTSRLVRVDLERPDARSTRLRRAPGTELGTRRSLDVAAESNVFAPFDLPDTVAGLPRRGESDDFGAVGIYGRGPTSVLAVPLRRGLAGQVRDQLSTAAGAQQTSDGTALQVGPLSVLLTARERGRGTFLLAGTVTPQTLSDVGNDVKSDAVFR